MLEKGRAWIASNPDTQQPWDSKGYRIPGGDPSSPKVAQMLAIAPAMLRDKTKGCYPAPEAIMCAAVEGAQVDFDTALRIESRYFIQLATGQVAKNMISAFFFQLQEIKKGASRPAGYKPWQPSKVGVLGAGMMGSGIAWSCANSGIDVVLKDVSLASAEKGKAYSASLLEKRVAKGRMDQAKAEAILSRITPTESAEDLAGCDMIIEAVFEVFVRLEKVISPDISELGPVKLQHGKVLLALFKSRDIDLSLFILKKLGGFLLEGLLEL